MEGGREGGRQREKKVAKIYDDQVTTRLKKLTSCGRPSSALLE